MSLNLLNFVFSFVVLLLLVFGLLTWLQSSGIAVQQRQWEAIHTDLTTVAAAQETLRATNQAEHARLSCEAQQAIAQLTTDGQFLEHVREIIRFFKTA